MIRFRSYNKEGPSTILCHSPMRYLDKHRTVFTEWRVRAVSFIQSQSNESANRYWMASRGSPALTFTEEVLLLLLDGEDGSFLPIGKNFLHRAMAASVLMELAFANRIDTDATRLMVIDPERTGNPMLDHVLERIADSKETKDTKEWLDILSAEEGFTIRERGLTRLVERGILKNQERKFLWIFRSRRYAVIDGKAEREAKRRISELLFSEEIPDPRDVALICLVDACGILRLVFEERVLRQVAPRIELLCKMDLIGKELIAQLAIWKLGYRASAK